MSVDLVQQIVLSHPSKIGPSPGLFSSSVVNARVYVVRGRKNGSNLKFGSAKVP